MKKKILTSLLVSTTLNVVTIPVVFAENDSSINLSKMNYRSLYNISYDNIIKKTYNRLIGGLSHPFDRVGFQAFYDSERNHIAHGYVSDIENNVFKVFTGFFKIGDKLYHSDSNGYSSIGLQRIGDKLYYFNENEKDPYAKTGWQDINGQKYYFDKDSFVAKKGIQEIFDGCYYYFNDDCQLKMGLREIDGKVYNFNSKGGKASLGWCNIGNKRYYFNPEDRGAAKVGWYSDSGGSVYFHKEDGKKGVMATGITQVDKDYYLFLRNSNGDNYYKQYGFYTDKHTASKDRYFFNPEHNGAAHKGWYYDNKSRAMYFNDEGIMQNGVTEINGLTYYFKSTNNDWNAYQQLGWQVVDGKKYYFNPVLGPNGQALEGLRVIDGKIYEFDNKGVLIGSIK